MTPSTLRPLLLFVYWLGLNGLIVFFLQLCLGIFSPWPTLILSLAALVYIVRSNPLKPLQSWKPWAVIGIIAFFLLMHSLHYPLGGWDAWSCWNLKAKFIYLGQLRFWDMFEPHMWRSNTQYPLLLPCINVWFWDLTGGAHEWGPMIISIMLSVTAAAILLFAILEIAKQEAAALLVTTAVFLLPFITTLCAGQYSDLLVGLLLLCAFICYLTDDLRLMGAFLGMLSFTKTEGTVAAVILAALTFILKRDKTKSFLPSLLAFSLPTVLFTLLMAPRNEAFINGLISAAKPATLQRLITVLTYPAMEMLSLKWNGLWVIVITAGIWRRKSLMAPKLRIFGLFFAGFLTVLLAYYQTNTFFEINWWLNTTLHRILFMILPSLCLWISLGL